MSCKAQLWIMADENTPLVVIRINHDGELTGFGWQLIQIVAAYTVFPSEHGVPFTNSPFSRKACWIIEEISKASATIDLISIDEARDAVPVSIARYYLFPDKIRMECPEHGTFEASWIDAYDIIEALVVKS